MTTTSHGLRRELKLRDLVLMQVVLIFSLGWTGFAAKQGSGQIVLWLIAIVLFYMPLAAVVMRLSRTIVPRHNPTTSEEFRSVGSRNRPSSAFVLQNGGLMLDTLALVLRWLCALCLYELTWRSRTSRCGSNSLSCLATIGARD